METTSLLQFLHPPPPRSPKPKPPHPRTNRKPHNGTEIFHLFDPQTLPSSHILTPPARSLIHQLDCYFLSSFHGVICFYCDTGFVLWNPSIRRMLLPITVPKSRNYDPFPDYDTFRALKSFWYDPVTNEFKIVLFCYFQHVVALFSSKEQEWIEIGGGEIGAKILALHEQWQVVIDGVAYWIACYNTKSSISGDGVIVSFDFGRDELGTIEIPKDLVMGDDQDIGDEVNIFKWQDSLSIARYDALKSEGVVWAMRNGLWSMMVRFKLPVTICSVFCYAERRGRVLGLTDTGHVVLIDPKGCTLVKSKFLDEDCSPFMYDFVESLAFPDNVSKRLDAA